MNDLFDHAGITLAETKLSLCDTPIVSDIVLKTLVKKACEAASQNAKTSPQLLFAPIFWTLQNYFSIIEPDIGSDTLRQDMINLTAKYLAIQDVLECHSLKEVHSLASGLFDTVITKWLGLMRATLQTELLEQNKLLCHSEGEYKSL